MEIELDAHLIRKYANTNFVEGWAITHYSENGIPTTTANRIYVCKYFKGGYSFEDRETAGNILLKLTKQFIHNQWPIESRPFNSIVVPPANLDKEFNLTSHIASRLEAGGIKDLSDGLSKVRHVTPLKNVALENRKVEIDGSMEFEYLPSGINPTGVLIFDDILGGGNTANEVSRAIRQALPDTPQYYLALTYIKGQAIQ
jgi:hypothetical protein